MRYFFHIGYKGTNYYGWQRQQFTDSLRKTDPNPLTIQEVLEGSLSRILKATTSIIGCGRTDTGVHASQYFFHCDIEHTWDYDLVFRLNKILPKDIAIFDIIKMEGTPHARWDAIQRTYDYFIHSYKNPFLSEISSLYLKKNLDLDAMKKAVSLLTRYSDYYGFCKSPNKYEHTICKISEAKLLCDIHSGRLRFHISSNRFLHRMIRILVGKFLKIGSGEFSLEEFEYCLANKKTPATIIPAYPQGLFLSKVTYPFLDLKPRSEFSSVLLSDTECEWLEV